MRSYPAFDQVIEVEFRAFPAMLWLAAGFEVRVGDRVYHPQLGRSSFSLHPITEFDLFVDGKHLRGMVRGVGPRYFFIKKRYSLVVGMSELARDTQTMRGWLPAYLAVLGFVAVFLLTSLGLFVIGLAIHGK